MRPDVQKNIVCLAGPVGYLSRPEPSENQKAVFPPDLRPSACAAGGRAESGRLLSGPAGAEASLRELGPLEGGLHTLSRSV